jgi:hypothetical protein
LDRDDKFPERKHFGVLAPGGQEGVDRKHDEIGRQNAQDPPGKETSQLDGLVTGKWREELPADQVTAQDEKEIDADPAEAIEASRSFETEKRGMINRDDDDSCSAEKIEPGLALTLSEARVDVGLRNLVGDGRKLAGRPGDEKESNEVLPWKINWLGRTR